jgi:hypothetical protein
MGAIRGDGFGIVELVARPEITLTRWPVLALSSVTDWSTPSPSFVTQTWMPSEEMPLGPLNL